ncbi:ABC transporter ATP-binding protein/permease [Microbacterium sp.]|uniref:ABC transporter ATP-binding protein/permease n=1 Tax=Microbacterium sp. TaxID=51671 RepID=UPI0039E40792
MFVSRSLLAFARPVAGWIVATTLVGLAASAASVAVAVAVSALVGLLLTEGGAPDVSRAALVMVGAVVARAALLWVRDLVAAATGVAAKRRLRERLVRQLFHVGPGARWSRGEDAVATTVVDGTEHLQAYLGLYLPQLVVAFLVPALLVGVIGVQAPAVAVVIAACLITIPLSQRLWARILGERAYRHWDAYEAYAARVADSLRGIVTLASLGAAGRRAQILARDADSLRAATNASLRASLGIAVVTAAAMSVGTAGASLLAAAQTADGMISPATALMILFLAAECFRPLQELQSYWHEGFHAVAASAGIRRILEQSPRVREAERPDGAPLPAAPAIVMRGVGYRHPGADRDALADIDLEIPGGATVAIVGRSGAGKTTLASLLLRDADPDRGRVFVGGRDLRSLPLALVRSCVVRVAQDVVLLDGTLRENIRAAAPTASDDAFLDAVRIARVDEFVDRLPDAWDARVGEGGSALSGGQRQRAALARALLADARVLVLDEATSALDAENESLISDALRAGRGARTTIVIAHRLSTVADADLVVVLDDGRIVEAGPPDRLARSGGSWARMLDLQREGVR